MPASTGGDRRRVLAPCAAALLALTLLAAPTSARAADVDLLAQAGWNLPGLLGLGAAWSPVEHLELDGSLDFGLAPALSVDARWRILSGRGGPFLGLGWSHAGGGEVHPCHRAFDETHCSDAVAYSFGSSDALPIFIGARTPDLWRLWAALRAGWSFLLGGGKLTAGTEAADPTLAVPSGFLIVLELGVRIR